MGVVFTCWGARWEQRLEKLSFLRRTVFGVARCAGATASPFAGARHAGGSKARRGQLGREGLCLGQGLRFPPQVGFDQHQVILELHKDLALRRRSQLTGGEVRQEQRGRGGLFSFRR